MVIVPVRVPLAVGLKVTLIEQLAPAATVVSQVLVWPKSPGLLPPIVIANMVKGALPVFVSVTDCGEL